MTGRRVAIVSGSGLDLRPLLDAVSEELSFRDFSGLRTTSIAGHEGRFLVGRSCGVEVVLQCGRLHAYEGFSLDVLRREVEVLAELGAHTVCFTNASGGLSSAVQPGSLVAVDAVWCWPYRRYVLPDIITPSLVAEGADFQGPYVWMHGPCYETRAEIQALASWKAAVVGMSTAPEMVHCADMGLRTVAVSCVTNHCLRPSRLTHDHVIEVAGSASNRLRDLLVRNLPRWAEPVS